MVKRKNPVTAREFSYHFQRFLSARRQCLMNTLKLFRQRRVSALCLTRLIPNSQRIEPRVYVNQTIIWQKKYLHQAAVENKATEILNKVAR